MAIFLLLYIFFCLIWLFWAGALSYLLLRYRYPDSIGVVSLTAFWAITALIFLISIVYLLKADWVSVPSFLEGIGG